jgi:hypothetical protein
LSDGFLSRWSRRKQALARGEEAAEPQPAPAAATEAAPGAAPGAAPEAAPGPEPLAQRVAAADAPVPAQAPPPSAPEPELDLSSLPEIETLDAATDIRAFFQKGVPEALRNAALRKAYATDPVISTYMGPLDYAWDFNTPGGLPLGFASELGEVGERLRQLIAQAVGEPAPPSEAVSDGVPEQPLAEAPLPPAAITVSEPEPGVEPPPPSALRLAEEAPALASPPGVEEGKPPPPPRRRHGGALPA